MWLIAVGKPNEAWVSSCIGDRVGRCQCILWSVHEQIVAEPSRPGQAVEAAGRGTRADFANDSAA